jgi:hypothetical protein
MDWIAYNELSEDDYWMVKSQAHVAIQNVAAVARAYLGDSPGDETAVLHWVPGFWRMAGQWVKGETAFRSSLSFKDFNIYLVDRRVNVLAQYSLQGKTHNQAMVWLEEQILSLGLGSRAITLALPYELPLHNDNGKDVFTPVRTQLFYEFGKLYHNTYSVLLQLKSLFPKKSSDIRIWPHHFDMSLEVTLKETGERATNTMIKAGFSPGDPYFEGPYFYVNTQPFVDVESLPALENGMWFAEDWTGAVVMLSSILSFDDPAEALLDFYKKTIKKLTAVLLK